MTDDPQQIWDDYYQRIRWRRIREAEIVHAKTNIAGITDSTILALGFRHFTRQEESVRNFAAQLSENYPTTISQSQGDDNYWVLEGTTRPDGIREMTHQRCIDWVSFMCDVAQSHGCVFSTWKLTDQHTGCSWSSQEIDVDPECEKNSKPLHTGSRASRILQSTSVGGGQVNRGVRRQ